MSLAYLVLDDGTAFPGTAWGATGLSTGPLEVCTLMTGYQGLLTSPDTTGKIVLMTAPHVGNVGMNDETATAFTAAGLVVREPARRPSNWKSTGSFDDALTSQGLVGIAGVDTRAVTLHLREAGRPFRATIISGDALPPHTVLPAEDATSEVIQVALAALTTALEAN